MFLTLDEYLGLPREPQPWVVQDLVPVGGLVNVFGKPKCLALDTKVPTPIGMRTMAQLRVGDEVYGPNGQPIRITSLSPVYEHQDCYELTLMDGTTIVADGVHRWPINYKGQRVTLTTEELFTKGWSSSGERYKGKQTTKYKWRLPLTTGPATYKGTSTTLSLDPYCFGTWLGDGHANSGALTSADPFIVEQWTKAGWNIVARPSAKYAYGIHQLKPTLEALGVLGNKHIPGAYMQAGVETRRALLAGLLDTDGWCSGGAGIFYNTNERLAQQVRQLAQGLGYKTTWSSKQGQYKKNGVAITCKVCYIVNIRAHEPIFRLPRKLAKQKLNTERYVAITHIRKAPSVPVQCITVDHPESIFLITDSHVQTHNSGKSFLMLGITEAIANGDPDWEGFIIHKHGPVAYLQVDTPREEWANRATKIAARTFDAHTNIHISDMWMVPEFPFNILNPNGINLRALKDHIERIKPVMVVIDTLREIHDGDENDSTVMRNVITALVAACRPAAIVLVSHSRKDGVMTASGDDDLMDQQRGSSYVSGRMDVIVKVSQKRLVYKGRATGQQTYPIRQDERGFIHVEREADDNFKAAHHRLIQANPGLSDNAIAESIAREIGISHSTALRKLKQHFPK